MDQDRQDALTEQALRWLVVLNDDAAKDADRAAFAAWLARGPSHRAAWTRAQYVWSRAGVIEPAIRARRTDTRAMPPLADKDRGWSRRRWFGAVAAGGLLAMAGGYTFLRHDLLADYATAAGERRTVALADGSSVELGGASALTVSYTAGERKLSLTAGEAFFTVAPDTQRPFMVTARGVRAKALGTAFNVKLMPDAVQIAVAEHAVAVAAAGGVAVEVPSEWQVSYGVAGFGPVSPADLGAALAWRRGRLVFHDAPLSDVVADLERYRGGRVLILDEGIATLPVTAVIDVREADAMLDIIAATLPVRVRRLTGLLVLIGSAT